MKCSSKNCTNNAVFHVMDIRENRVFASDQALCGLHADEVWESHVRDSRVGPGNYHRFEKAACFVLELIVAENEKEIHKVLLREVGTQRVFAIRIGFIEYYLLCQAVQESPHNDSTLHVALKRLVQHFGGKVSYVIIDDVCADGNFVAKIVLLHNKKAIALQVRPSDGLAFSILAKVSFFVAEAVLAKYNKTAAEVG